MSLIQSMNIAQQALNVNQGALSIVSNNIANMNTEGYHKQRADLATLTTAGAIGSNVYAQINSSAGVEITAIQRYTNVYLQNYYREQNSDYEYLNQASQIASSVENLFNETTGSGLSDIMSKFYDSVSNLNQYPADSTARLNFVEQAKSVAQKLNSISSSLDDYRTSLVGDGVSASTLSSSKAGLTVSDINTTLESIANINDSLLKASAGGLSSNNLLDQRDALIDELSSLMNVEVTETSDGAVNISLGGSYLVRGTETTGKLTLSVGDTDTPAIVKLVTDDGKTSGSLNGFITGGDLGAILNMSTANSDSTLNITDIQNQLDTMASGFAQTVNEIQTQTGAMAIDKTTMTLTPSTESIFVASDGSSTITAGNIKVNDTVYNDPYLVAAAKVDDPMNYDENAVGNGSNMLDLTGTRTGSFSYLNNSSPEGYFTEMVAQIGINSGTIETNLSSQKTVLSSISTQLASETGVDLNEELIDLTKYQRAYEASARIFNVCDDLLELLTNLGA